MGLGEGHDEFWKTSGKQLSIVQAVVLQNHSKRSPQILLRVFGRQVAASHAPQKATPSDPFRS
jgi:hypothetical protein